MSAGAVIGREEELGEIRACLTAAAEGPAGLLLTGEPGIGKTALWESALALARVGDARVLTHRSVQTEATFAFSGLSDVVAPAYDDVADDLPSPRRAALRPPCCSRMRRTGGRRSACHRPRRARRPANAGGGVASRRRARRPAMARSILGRSPGRRAAAPRRHTRLRARDDADVADADDLVARGTVARARRGSTRTGGDPRTSPSRPRNRPPATAAHATAYGVRRQPLLRRRAGSGRRVAALRRACARAGQPAHASRRATRRSVGWSRGRSPDSRCAGSTVGRSGRALV